MAKPKILVTRLLPDRIMSLLEEHFQVEANPHDRPMSREEILEKIVGRQGLVSMLCDRIDGELLDRVGPELRIVANYAVGFNNIDLAAATERGVFITNTPGVLTDSTADLAVALMLAVARRVVEGDALVRSGRFQGWAPSLLLGSDLHHKTLGIVGLGRIGTAVARRAAGFDMRILYWGRRRADPELEKELHARFVDKETLLAESDFVSLHVPLTPETHHLIGADELARMRPTAFLINTARGEVIDEAALVTALREKRIAGAGLDVYEHEPHVSPPLTRMENVVLLPHIGSASIETRIRMGDMVVENLMDALVHGRVPPNLVNRELRERNPG